MSIIFLHIMKTHWDFIMLITKLGGGFKYIFFYPYLRKWSNLTNIFQMGWNHQLEKFEGYEHILYTYLLSGNGL